MVDMQGGAAAEVAAIDERAVDERGGAAVVNLDGVPRAVTPRTQPPDFAPAEVGAAAHCALERGALRHMTCHLDCNSRGRREQDAERLRHTCFEYRLHQEKIQAPPAYVRECV